MKRFNDIKYFGVKLSPNRIKNDKGQLIVTGCPFARTGKQKYHKSELGIVINPGEDEFIYLDRPVSEVSSPATIASFEGAPLTEDHPEEDVKVGVNWNYLSKGMAFNIKYVADNKANTKGHLEADLIFTEEKLIDDIENNRISELSAGYKCDVDEVNWTQTKIRGNHIAVVESARAGRMARIRDKKYGGKNVNDKVIDVKELLIELVTKVMGNEDGKIPRNRKEQYNKVIGSIEERKGFPGTYEMFPSFGMMLGEKNELADLLLGYKDALDMNLGPVFIVANKEDKTNLKDSLPKVPKTVKVGDKNMRVVDSYNYDIINQEGEIETYVDYYSYGEEGNKQVVKTVKL